MIGKRRRRLRRWGSRNGGETRVWWKEFGLRGVLACVAVACLSVALAVGCGHLRNGPPGAPPVAVDSPDLAPETPAGPEAPALEPAGLEGRIICIDPGHGGRWAGAAAHGLREAEVNLDVALRLVPLLEEAGAEVVLTRTGEYAVDNASLREDLEARVTLANEAGADAFVSIHHNAEYGNRGVLDDLEVYYQQGDPGPSMDLGQAILHHLAEDFRPSATRKRLLPGNYRVLRRSNMPAVLLESAYLTHRPSAEFLKDGAALERQARAIADGLARYFEMNPPVVEHHWVEEETPQGAPGARIAFRRGLPLDMETLTVTLDDAALSGAFAMENGFLLWRGARPLPNGQHRLVFEGRSEAGASFVHTVRMEIDRDPAVIHVTQHPPEVPDDVGAEVAFHVHVRDRFGLPVQDGRAVTLAGRGGRTRIEDGTAVFHIPAGDLGGALTFSAGDAETEWAVRRGGAPYRAVEVRARDGAPLEGVQLRTAAGHHAVTDRAGWASIPQEAGGNITLEKPGFEATEGEDGGNRMEFTLNPVKGGALHGRTIFLDPAHGGREPGAVGVGGLRASDVNLDVARRVAARLAAAGANPILARTRDGEISDLERVRAADGADAALYVRITFGETPPRNRDPRDPELPRVTEPYVAHYPGSANGERLARALADRLGIGETRSSHTYVLQQPAAPAVIIHPASIAADGEAFEFMTPEARRQAAANIYQALLDYFQEE